MHLRFLLLNLGSFVKVATVPKFSSLSLCTWPNASLSTSGHEWTKHFGQTLLDSKPPGPGSGSLGLCEPVPGKIRIFSFCARAPLVTVVWHGAPDGADPMLAFQALLPVNGGA